MKKLNKHFHDKVMAFTLDNIIRRLFVNPVRLLEKMGVKEGQKVIDIGCGPGFFTISASKIVGDDGFVFALDILPIMIKKIKNKIQKNKFGNIKAILTDAKYTGLKSGSIDIVIIIDTIADLSDLDSVLKEMNRILKSDGILSVYEGLFGHWKPEKVQNVIEYSELFTLMEKEEKILIFNKMKG